MGCFAGIDKLLDCFGLFFFCCCTAHSTLCDHDVYLTSLESEGLRAGCPRGGFVLQREHSSGRPAQDQPELHLSFMGYLH